MREARKDIEHNLEVAKPMFLYFITNMNPELSKWIQYVGVERTKRGLFFNFKSSQNQLRFSVYAGVDISNTYELLSTYSDMIYKYFRSLKYDNI